LALPNFARYGREPSLPAPKKKSPSVDRRSQSSEVLQPNRFRVADITVVWALEGWLYLAAVLNLHDRQVVGWAHA
jgi:transposase InsO family protein